MAALVAILGLLGATLGYAIWDRLAFDQAVNQVELRADFCGRHFNRKSIEDHLRRANADGEGWARAADSLGPCGG